MEQRTRAELFVYKRMEYINSDLFIGGLAKIMSKSFRKGVFFVHINCLMKNRHFLNVF